MCNTPTVSLQWVKVEAKVSLKCDGSTADSWGNNFKPSLQDKPEVLFKTDLATSSDHTTACIS